MSMRALHVRPRRWISWTNVAFGVWLVFSAFLLPPVAGRKVIANVIAGSFVSLAGLWSALAFRPRISLLASGTVALVGVWVASAPYTLGYLDQMPAINDVIVGLAIACLGTTNMVAKAGAVGSGQPTGKL